MPSYGGWVDVEWTWSGRGEDVGTQTTKRSAVESQCPQWTPHEIESSREATLRVLSCVKISRVRIKTEYY